MPAIVEETLSRVDGAPARDLDDLVAADARGPQGRSDRVAAGVTIFVAILGLGLLILVHELGHFVVSLALGMRPRRFYIGFPPAIWKTTRNGIEYGIGAVPLGGFVKIPGMHRPAPVDVDTGLGRVLADAPELGGAANRLRGALAAGDHDAARDSVRVLRELVDERELDPRAASAAGKSLDDLDDALGPDAYWRARDVEARRGDRRGPGREHPARARPLHGAVHDVGRQGDDDRRRRLRGVARADRRAAGRRPDRLDRRDRRAARGHLAPHHWVGRQAARRRRRARRQRP